MATDYAALWQELNTRQQFYLKTIYEEDQAREAERRAAGAAGEWNRTPASEWRLIDAYHEPAASVLLGITALQSRWRGAGHHDQGTGSTIKVLIGHDLITTDLRPTRFGVMHQVAMTKRGRALMRWVTRPRTARAKPPLPERAAEVLGQLYTASLGSRGYLDWPRSPTIAKHLAPRGLARERDPRGFEITEDGVTHLTAHHAVYAAAYPTLNLPDPTGAAGWPAEADRLLDTLRDECRSLARTIETATKDAQTQHRQAGKEFTEALHRREAPTVRDLQREVHELQTGHAKMLADVYDRYRDQMRTQLAERLPQYAAATLAAAAALTEGTDPAAAIRAQMAAPVAALPAYVPTGLPAIDVEAARLHTACTRTRRRAATARRGRVKAATGLQTDAVPVSVRGTDLEQPWALAAHLHWALREGYLYRLLTAQPEAPRPAEVARPG